MCLDRLLSLMAWALCSLNGHAWAVMKVPTVVERTRKIASPLIICLSTLAWGLVAIYKIVPFSSMILKCSSAMVTHISLKPPLPSRRRFAAMPANRFVNRCGSAVVQERPNGKGVSQIGQRRRPP